MKVVIGITLVVLGAGMLVAHDFETEFALTRDLLQSQVQEWTERLAAAEKYPHDRTSLRVTEQSLDKKYRVAREEIHSSYGVAPRDRLVTRAGSAQDWQTWLSKRPEMEITIRSLKAEREALVSRYERLMAQQRQRRRPR